jgi:hypothetical protein
VSRLYHHRPQHQGQAEPRQPSQWKPHAFLHWARFTFNYNGCLAQGNAGRVTMGSDCYVVPIKCRKPSNFTSEEAHVGTNLRRT